LEIGATGLDDLQLRVLVALALFVVERVTGGAREAPGRGKPFGATERGLHRALVLIHGEEARQQAAHHEVRGAAQQQAFQESTLHASSRRWEGAWATVCPTAKRCASVPHPTDVGAP